MKRIQNLELNLKMTNLCDFCLSIKESKKDSINLLELYSGIGGMRYGFLNCGLLVNNKIQLNVTAIDISPNANDVYKFNFNDNDHYSRVIAKNLASITVKELDQLGPFDIVTISCPCQPFTRQHDNQEFEDLDSRTESFNHLVTNIFPNLKNKPNYFLIENVKNFEKSKAAQRVKMMFKQMNYNYREFMLQPFQFGIPNSRLRYYCLAKYGEFCFTSNDETISTEYPSELSENSCKNCKETYFKDLITTDNQIKKDKFDVKKIEDYLNDDEENLEQYELKPELIQKYLKAIDIVRKDSRMSCCFTSSYGNYLTGTGSFILLNNDLSIDQLNELKNNELADRSKIKLRKLTPKEIANLMGFPRSFRIPNHFTVKQSYKVLGNSVNINVISYMLKLLLLNC